MEWEIDLSVEGLETLHKLVRRFCKMLARKTNLLDNLKDVFLDEK
jgi:predicted RNA-binding protein with PUA domain